LLVQLQRLPDQLSVRSANAGHLDEKLSGLPFLQVAPPDHRVTCHGHYLYLIRVRPEELGGIAAETFIEALSSEGISWDRKLSAPDFQSELFKHHNYRITIIDRPMLSITSSTANRACVISSTNGSKICSVRFRELFRTGSQRKSRCCEPIFDKR
jgi:dTDP-4-amino-4,6-dideoxygalactose transaminase